MLPPHVSHWLLTCTVCHQLFWDPEADFEFGLCGAKVGAGSHWRNTTPSVTLHTPWVRGQFSSALPEEVRAITPPPHHHTVLFYVPFLLVCSLPHAHQSLTERDQWQEHWLSYSDRASLYNMIYNHADSLGFMCALSSLGWYIWDDIPQCNGSQWQFVQFWITHTPVFIGTISSWFDLLYICLCFILSCHEIWYRSMVPRWWMLMPLVSPWLFL